VVPNGPPPIRRQLGYNADPVDGILGQYDALANKEDTQVVYNYAQELAGLQVNNDPNRPKLQELKGLAGNPVGNGQDPQYHEALTRAFEAAVAEMRDQQQGARRRRGKKTRKTRKTRKGGRKTRRGGNLFKSSKTAPAPATVEKDDTSFSMTNPALEGYSAKRVAQGVSPMVAMLEKQKLLKTAPMGAFDVDVPKPVLPGLTKGGRSKKTTRRRR
jgi:hypothetical protein